MISVYFNLKLYLFVPTCLLTAEMNQHIVTAEKHQHLTYTVLTEENLLGFCSLKEAIYTEGLYVLLFCPWKT